MVLFLFRVALWFLLRLHSCPVESDLALRSHVFLVLFNIVLTSHKEERAGLYVDSTADDNLHRKLNCVSRGVMQSSLYASHEVMCLSCMRSFGLFFFLPIEGASVTRYLNPLLGKTELSIISCRKHVSSSDYLPLTIEMSQDMNLKVFSMTLQRS